MRTDQTLWILEDNPEEVFVYREILGLRYSLRIFSNLKELEQALTSDQPAPKPALLIADLRLPDGDFLTFLGQTEAADSIPSFLMVSSNDDLDVLRACFEGGALDYLTKPFTENELLVKIERFLKLGSPTLEVRTVNRESLNIKVGADSRLTLTPKEYHILKLLHGSQRGVTRKEIQSQIWRDVAVSSKTFDVHLFYLRRKLTPFNIQISFRQPDLYVLSCNGMDLAMGGNPSLN
jgi:DNA-binding response OmpR family regulator